METGGAEQPVNVVTCLQSAEPAERWNSHSDDPDPSVGLSPGKIFACVRNSLGDRLYLHITSLFTFVSQKQRFLFFAFCHKQIDSTTPTLSVRFYFSLSTPLIFSHAHSSSQI